MRVMWVMFSVLLITLSGCASETNGAEEPDAVDDGGSGTDAGNETIGADDTPADNTTQQDTGDDVSPLDIGFIATNLTGTAPLTVNFTINGTAPDATWHIDFGDNTTANGTGVPAVVNHTFEEGNHTVRLDVQDGERNTTQTLQVDVAPGALPSGQFIREETYEISGTVALGSEIPFVRGCGANADAQNFHDLAIPVEEDGQALAVSKFVVHMDLGTTNGDSDIRLWDPDGNNVGESSDWNYEPGVLGGSGSATEDFTSEGHFPGGAYEIEVYSCVAVEGDYDITITASLVAA